MIAYMVPAITGPIAMTTPLILGVVDCRACSFRQWQNTLIGMLAGGHTFTAARTVLVDDWLALLCEVRGLGIRAYGLLRRVSFKKQVSWR